jgi:hypothetical protein
MSVGNNNRAAGPHPQADQPVVGSARGGGRAGYLRPAVWLRVVATATSLPRTGRRSGATGWLPNTWPTLTPRIVASCREKGGTQQWQPITPTLTAALADHTYRRSARRPTDTSTSVCQPHRRLLPQPQPRHASHLACQVTL